MKLGLLKVRLWCKRRMFRMFLHRTWLRMSYCGALNLVMKLKEDVQNVSTAYLAPNFILWCSEPRDEAVKVDMMSGITLSRSLFEMSLLVVGVPCFEYPEVQPSCFSAY